MPADAMTGLRQRLTDALTEHFVVMAKCEEDAWEQWEDAVDCLLSLPGIAVVDTDADIDWIAERMADADDVIYGLLTPDEAEFYKRMARAALLAAADTKPRTSHAS